MSPAGAALRGSLGRGAQSPKRARRDPPPRLPRAGSLGPGGHHAEGPRSLAPAGKEKMRNLGICCEGVRKSSCSFLLETPWTVGVWSPNGHGIPKSSPSLLLDTKETGLWEPGMGEPLRVDLKGECGTLASSFSPPKFPDGLLLVGMDDFYGTAPKRVVSIPWSLIPGCPGCTGRQ